MKINKEKLSKAAALLIPPIFVLVFTALIFKKNDMYPFGTKSLSWCDMSQQVIPLLNQFKDILDGEGSIFFSFKNSGGMNFYGVFFFFLASPFSFLVKFVDKADMMMFANVLVALKMAVCAFTASFFFTFCRKKLDAPSTILLSVMYPFCGYTMMYYQNIIWLDMMYLFPLLLIALDRITRKQNSVMYIIVLTAMMIVNYYIGYMIVVFILLFVAVYAIKNRGNDYCSRICREFFMGSFIAALLSAVVWLPSLIQYTRSGRGQTSLIDSLAGSNFVVSYQTVLPMLFCTAFAFVVIVCDMTAGRKRSDRNNRMLILLGLTLIPFFIEPINKMWHTGNYMSFPNRFGFITVFLALVCAAYVLEQPIDCKNNIPLYLIGGVVCVFAITLCYRYVFTITENNSDAISKYSRTLWGDDTSFKLLLGIFLVMIIGYTAVYAVYRFGFIFKNVFLALTAILFLIESYNYSNIYMTAPAENNKETNKAQSEIYQLEDKVDDDDFWRMKSYAKVYNNNMIGALGYNSISHYTSLNDEDYMFTMKRLGYSGVWMETSSVGGTRLTDALLSIKYEINGGVSGCEKVYESKAGSIYRLPEYLPMGLLLDKNALDGCEEIPEELTRTQVQEYLSEKVFGENLIEEYEPLMSVEYSGGKFYIPTGTKINYTIDVIGDRTIYLDCFDELTNHLKEPIFDSLEVKVNGEINSVSYPTSTNNGVLRLGDFSDEHVTVSITVSKDIECASFGLFGLDTARLSELCEQAEGVGLCEDGDGLSGSCTTDGAKTCFVSAPYNDGFTVKVNGEKVEYSRVFSGFICFDLKSGKNDIEISYIPKGFIAGVVISGIGVLAFAAYIIFRKKLDRSFKCDTAAKYVMTAAVIIAIIAVYIMPIAVNILMMV